MGPLTTLERRLLSLLEEAGEEHLSALMNSVAKPSGEQRDISAMAAALVNLLKIGLIEVSQDRDSQSRRLLPLPLEDSMSILLSVPSILIWNQDMALWAFRDGVPMIDILTTTAGIEWSRRILAEDGWPAEKLPRYE